MIGWLRGSGYRDGGIILAIVPFFFLASALNVAPRHGAAKI